MFHQELLLLDWESVQKPLNAGMRRVRSKPSKPPAVNDATTAIQLEIPKQIDQSSYMPEFQAALKNLTLTHRLSFLKLVTPEQNLSATSEAASTSKEKVFKPYWNGFSQMIADWLSLPTKTAFVGLGSILSHGSAIAKNVRFWFSTKRTSAQSEKWLKTSLPLSTSLAADYTDSASTKKLYVKTLSYRVYPGKALNSLWKQWVGATRKVYNSLSVYAALSR